jgi:hypothetical protein
LTQYFYIISEVKVIFLHQRTVRHIKGITNGKKTKETAHGRGKGEGVGGSEDPVIIYHWEKVYIQRTECQLIGQGHILVTVLVQVILDTLIQVQDLDQDQGHGHQGEETLTEEIEGEDATAGKIMSNDSSWSVDFFLVSCLTNNEVNSNTIHIIIFYFFENDFVT